MLTETRLCAGRVGVDSEEMRALHIYIFAFSELGPLLIFISAAEWTCVKNLQKNIKNTFFLWKENKQIFLSCCSGQQNK